MDLISAQIINDDMQKALVEARPSMGRHCLRDIKLIHTQIKKYE